MIIILTTVSLLYLFLIWSQATYWGFKFASLCIPFTIKSFCLVLLLTILPFSAFYCYARKEAKSKLTFKEISERLRNGSW